MLDLKKTGVKVIACIYINLLQHVNSNVSRSSPMKLNTIYHSRDIGVPNDDRTTNTQPDRRLVSPEARINSQQATSEKLTTSETLKKDKKE